MNPNVQDLLNELPVTLVEDPDFDDTELILYIQRLASGTKTGKDHGDHSWFAFYAPEDEGEMVNGTLTGAGLTMVEALQDLLHNYQTDYKQWLEDQRKEP